MNWEFKKLQQRHKEFIFNLRISRYSEVNFEHHAIHQVKTKKIATLKEVWIPGPLISIDFDDFTSPFMP